MFGLPRSRLCTLNIAGRFDNGYMVEGKYDWVLGEQQGYG